MNFYTIFHTPFGEGALIYTKVGVKRLILPKIEEVTKVSTLAKITKDPEYILSLKEKLEAYFASNYKGDFLSYPKDIRNYPKVYQIIWDNLVKLIKYGEVCSYGKFAQKLLLSNKEFKDFSYLKLLFLTRAALKANPLAVIIPCHRIIKKDGTLGGYTPAGKLWKRRLLILEGIIIE
jgi:O6-methylguanine-DNA--protein-cysteine methyltransferase